ncbi:Exocyst complex component 1 [Smittium culicis]|uniref:Exocyst complex component 1 n=2 Tax=Smittium culicis TaxID=133412 RepID=A0A1R1XVM7_9FUNG|nr:Exocyst complex component 1 [Smittium culicis]
MLDKRNTTVPRPPAANKTLPTSEKKNVIERKNPEQKKPSEPSTPVKIKPKNTLPKVSTPSNDPEDLSKNFSNLNLNNSNHKPVDNAPELTLNESTTDLTFADDGLDLNEDLMMDDYFELQPTSEDLLLDQTFMLSADELYGSFGWKANVDAAELESRLLLELSKLESENVRDVLEAEKKVPTIIVELEKSIKELDVFDILLKKYRDELDSMGDDVHQIQVENENLKIEEINQQKLLADLENYLAFRNSFNFTRKISVSEDKVQLLTNETLETYDGISRIQQIAASLQSKLSMNLDGGLEEMSSFQSNKKKYEYYCSNFSVRVYDYLKVMFQFKSEESLSKKSKPSNRGIHEISSPVRVHQFLAKYCGLTLWLREMKPSADKDLQAIYIQNMNKLYNSEGNDLLDSCRSFFFRIRHNNLNYLFVAPSANAVSSTGLSYSARRSSVENEASAFRTSNVGSNLPDKDLGLDMSPSLAFKYGLETIIQSVISEKNFMADLFHYSPSRKIASDSSQDPRRERKVKDTLGFPTFREWVNDKWEPIGNWDTPRPNYSKESASKEVFSMLDLLFGNLKANIDSMIDMGTRFDPSQSLGMLSTVEQNLEQCKGSGLEFAQKILNSAKLKLTGIFNQFSQAQISYLDDIKISTKKRTGIHPSVKIFPHFLIHMEILTENNRGSAKSLADQLNLKLGQKILELFNGIVSDAKNLASGMDIEEQKDYVNALVISLSNVFILRDGLKASSNDLASKLKSNSPPSNSKASNDKPELSGANLVLVKQFLNSSSQLVTKLQTQYVNIVIRRMMAKLIDFFSGLKEIESNQKNKSAAEQFPSTYNRAATRRMLSSFNSKEMRELIKQLYKRVDKHFGVGSFSTNSIFKSVWYDIREELLKIFLNYNQVLSNVYNESGVSFDFKQSDLLLWINESHRS